MDVDGSTFEEEVRGPGEPNLARAALLFAREIAYPDLRPSVWLARLDEWAEAVQGGLAPTEPPAARAERLARFLFDEVGLRGNREDYTDPRNSFLNEVMARGLGLPISLSVLYLELAARLGVTADGVGLPGHFVVSVHLPEAARLLDPFHGGGWIGQAEAARLVNQTTGFEGPLKPEWLLPTRPRAILARMLVNLRGVYVQREAWRPALAVVEHLATLEPDESEHLRDLGLLHFRSDSRRLGAEYLERYLRRRPSAPDAELIRRSLAGLVEQMARLN